MATKKKRTVAKKSAPVKRAKVKSGGSKVWGFDRDFLIISGGGLLVIVLTVLLLVG